MVKKKTPVYGRNVPIDSDLTWNISLYFKNTFEHPLTLLHKNFTFILIYCWPLTVN